MIENSQKLRQAFLSLLRAGLWGSDPDCEGFPLDVQEWEELHLQAQKQTVEGLIYDGILRLPIALFPPSLLMLRWTARIDDMERRNMRMNKAIGNINRWLENAGTTAWLMKGQGVATCYQHPLHRQCGDIDLYFPNASDGDKVIQLLNAEGITVEHQAGMSVVYWKEGCMIDQHMRLIDIHNPLMNRYLKQLIEAEAEQVVRWKTEEGENITLPSPLLAHLLSNAHILKHLMAVGIGFRQLCDSARICYQYHQCIDGQKLKKVYRKVGIYRWAQVLHRVLVEDLGMPEEYLPFPLSATKDTGWMRDVWSGGNFGFYDKRIGGAATEKRGKRMFRMLRYHLVPQIRYAPLEAFWFPLIQVFTRYHKRDE